MMKAFDRTRPIKLLGASVCLLGGLLTLAIERMVVPSLRASAGQSAAQTADTQPDLKPFVGTWKANFQGQLLAVLILKEQDGKLKGTLNDFDLTFDKDGNLADGTHIDFGDAPLLNVHFKSGALFFSAIEKDQYRPATEWKFVPVNSQEGELTPLLDNQLDKPKDLVAKPIRMVREHAKP
ncbi:MAG TPA: hypothetical protein VN822_06640 [Candidatus Acidoferrales bacterium]|nr:hypothetical protein [Candidatus Acidoferrales bacterium]